MFRGQLEDHISQRNCAIHMQQQQQQYAELLSLCPHIITSPGIDVTA